MLKKIKRIDYRHVLCLALVLGSAALGIFVYRYPLTRLGESIEAFLRSIAFAFIDMAELSERFQIMQTVNNYSKVELAPIIGFDYEALRDKLTGVWSQVFVGIHFQYYLIFLLWYFVKFLYVACLVILVGVVIAIPIIMAWDDTNNDYNEDTKPLQLFKTFVAAPCRRIYAWCRDLLDFFKNSRYFGIFIFVWLFNLGIFSVALSFLAYYLWALVTFNISTSAASFTS